MNRTILNRTVRICLYCFAMTAVTQGTLRAAPTQTIPLIQLERVPLPDAIRNLAQQTDQNFILDPRLGAPWIGPDGKPGQAPTVTARWENLSAQEALQKLLKEHGLTIVTNTATSIVRITYTNQPAPSLTSGTTQPGTNAVIPLITMSDVPLDIAVRNIASQAQLRIVIDDSFPGTAASPGAPPRPLPSVSVRWKNVTAREALTALLDNYDLLLVEDPTTGGAKVLPKAQPRPGGAPK